MLYKLLLLAPSAGGKSTLMRYLRTHTDLNIAETDELLTEANMGTYPTGKIKNHKLISETTMEVITGPSVVYLAQYIPEELLKLSRTKGFRTVLLGISLDELKKRNTQRMEIEHYPDASQWFQGQLDYFVSLCQKGLIDEVIDGTLPVKVLAEKIYALAKLTP
jgi:hypothetical protein